MTFMGKSFVKLFQDSSPIKRSLITIILKTCLTNNKERITANKKPISYVYNEKVFNGAIYYKTTSRFSKYPEFWKQATALNSRSINANSKDRQRWNLWENCIKVRKTQWRSYLQTDLQPRNNGLSARICREIFGESCRKSWQESGIQEVVNRSSGWPGGGGTARAADHTNRPPLTTPGNAPN